MMWLLLLMLPGLSQQRIVWHSNKWSKSLSNPVTLMINTAVDTIRSTEVEMERMEHIRINNRNSPAYEMGYLMKNLQENYRKQLEKYITVNHMGHRLYVAEFVLFLVEIEHHYWEAEHICNMIHEIERKWGLKEEGIKDYEAFLRMELQHETKHQYTMPHSVKRNINHTRWSLEQAISRHRARLAVHPTSSVVTKKRTGSWWPIEYGWEIDYYW